MIRIGKINLYLMLLALTLPVLAHSDALRSDLGNACPYISHHAISDSIRLQSSDVACLGTDPVITVTGTDITWYADAAKSVRLAQGNTYHSAPLHETTTFYLTQSVNGVESSVTPIVIEIVTAILVDIKTTPASCGKKDGTLTLVGEGGSERYPVQFKLDDGELQTSGTFTNLAAGTYLLTTQAGECFGTKEVTIQQQPSPVISAIDSVSPRCGNADGSLRIAAYRGNGTLKYSIDGLNFDTNNLFENLAGGEYTVAVRDDAQCMVSQTVSLKQSRTLQLNEIEVIPTDCGQPNGKVILPSVTGNGALLYSITGLAEQSLNYFDSLQSGRYKVSVRDEDGCTAGKEVVVADSQGPTIIHIDTQQPECELASGAIAISAGGVKNYVYSLDGIEFQQDSLFEKLAASTYVVTVKDENGCIARQNVDLSSSCSQQIFIPSAFSPNGDGINDAWAVFFSTAVIHIQEIAIFSRWGEIVYHSEPGNVSSGYAMWDGRYKGNFARGVFTYRMLVKFSNGSDRTFTGTVLTL